MKGKGGGVTNLELWLTNRNTSHGFRSLTDDDDDDDSSSSSHGFRSLTDDDDESSSVAASLTDLRYDDNGDKGLASS